MKKIMTNILFFYQTDKLVTVQRGNEIRTILRGMEVPLAEQGTDSMSASGLLATDDKGCVMSIGDGKKHLVYTVYGHASSPHSPCTILGFNGQPFDAFINAYLLGNGYRAYNPGLRRFAAPDSLSPYSEGGLNAYCYCESDPVNNVDPSGHFMLPLLKRLANRIVRYLAPGFGPLFQTTTKPDATTAWLERVKVGNPKPTPQLNNQKRLISTTSERQPLFRQKKPDKPSIAELISRRNETGNHSQSHHRISFSLLSTTIRTSKPARLQQSGAQ